METTNIEYWNNLRRTKQYESGGYYQCNDSELVKTEELSATTKDELFTAFYKKNNSLRYCNGSYYKFVDKKMEKEYNDWKKNLSEAKSFNLYYGNGVVD